MTKQAEIENKAINSFLKKCGKEEIMQEHFYSAIENNNIESVIFLLKNENVISNHYMNNPIYLSNESGHYDIVQLLWNDKCVKNTLKIDKPNLYEQLIKQDINNKVREF